MSKGNVVAQWDSNVANTANIIMIVNAPFKGPADFAYIKGIAGIL